jgi:glycosyltransferase involved in cell wall biosynthesis
VDDHSTDGTVDILKNANLGDRVKKIFHGKNMGKGAAIRTAQKYIEGEIMAIQDADMEYDPLELCELACPIKEGLADVVYGSRLWGGKVQRVYMFWHLVGNRFLTLVNNILYNSTLTDIETCYKVMRSEIFKKIEIRSNDFSFEPEITAKILKMKLRVYEMPISYYGRTYEEGKKIRWIHGFSALWTLLKYRFID